MTTEHERPTAGERPWRPRGLLADTIAGIGAVSSGARSDAEALHARLTTPPGALGRLEELGIHLAGVYDACPPPLPEPVAVAVFAADHGVHAQGVSPWPQEVTAQMVGNLAAGGAVVCALARQVGASVRVVDVGVAADLPDTPAVWARKVAHGTADMTAGPAMTPAEVTQAVEVGITVAQDLVSDGARLLVTGDMGIANTTASAALVSALTGLDPAVVTGRGTGVDDVGLARKVAVVRQAMAVNQVGRGEPLRVLAAVGGLEHAALTGFLLGAAERHTAVVLDGVIAVSAALVAQSLAPAAVAYWVAGHRSAEPGASAALEQLGLDPLLDLDLRLGEGSGAVLAVPLLQAAARVLREVATFDSAGVTDRS
jgi:nicotinate-nucleotide--dimethylbenzimidazole phosphoribosyltransferase